MTPALEPAWAKAGLITCRKNLAVAVIALTAACIGIPILNTAHAASRGSSWNAIPATRRASRSGGGRHLGNRLTWQELSRGLTIRGDTIQGHEWDHTKKRQ